MGALLECEICACGRLRADILLLLNGQGDVIAVLSHDRCTFHFLLSRCSFSGMQLY